MSDDERAIRELVDTWMAASKAGGQEFSLIHIMSSQDNSHTFTFPIFYKRPNLTSRNWI